MARGVSQRKPSIAGTRLPSMLVKGYPTLKRDAELIGKHYEFVKLTGAGVWTEVEAATVRITSTIHAGQTRSCKSFTTTFSLSLCGTSNPARKSPSITRPLFIQMTRGAFVARGVVAER